MSLLKRLFRPTTQDELSDDERAVLRRLAERMDGLEKADSRRELEWTMWYDKFRTLFMRLAKRVERADQLDRPTPESRQDAPGPTMDPLPLPKQWELAALARRGTNGQ